MGVVVLILGLTIKLFSSRLTEIFEITFHCFHKNKFSRLKIIKSLF